MRIRRTFSLHNFGSFFMFLIRLHRSSVLKTQLHICIISVFARSAQSRVRRDGAGTTWIQWNERYIRGSALNDGYKRFLLGEVNVVRTFVVYNDLEAMVRCNEKAMEYFSGGCSCIVTRRKEFTFGSPHLLYGYYKEKGRLPHTAEYLAQHSESLTAPIDGCGMGCDSVALAEYTL